MHKHFETMPHSKIVRVLLISCFAVGVIVAFHTAAYAQSASTNSSPSPTKIENRVNGYLITGPVDTSLQELRFDPKEIEKEKPKLQKELDKEDGLSNIVSSFWTRIKGAVENSDISVNVVNVNKTALDAFNAGVNDRVELSPAYIGGRTLREDAFTLKESFNPIEWLSTNVFRFIVPYKWGPQYPILISLQGQQEVDMWRLFKSYHDATHTRKIPFVDFVANELPATAQTLEKLDPGTEVRFDVPLNLYTGADYYVPVGSVAYLKGSLIKDFSGEYEVFVFRGNGTKARIRLVANRGRNLQGILQGGFGDQGFSKIIPWHIVENIVFAIFKLDTIGTVQRDYSNDARMFLADYTLNLKYQEVRDAYNELFAKALIFKNKRLNSLIWKIADPLNSGKKLRNLLISNLTKLEGLYSEDYQTQPDPDQRRVDRNFLGSDHADGKPLTWHYGLGNIFRESGDTFYRENELTRDSEMKDGKRTKFRYLIPEWLNHRHSAKFFNVFSEDKLHSSFMVYTADSAFNPIDFKLMGFSYNVRESRYGNPANRMVIRHFHNEFPPEVFSDVEQFMARNNLLKLDHLLRGVRVSARYFINEHALEAVEHRFYNSTPEQTFSTILYDLAMVTRSAGQLNAGPMFDPHRLADESICVRILAIDKALYPDDPALRYCGDLVYITQHLTAIMNPSLTPGDRKAAMDVLIKDDLFREIGPGLMFSLIPPNEVAKSLFVEIKFYVPTQVAPISYYFPRDPTTNNPIVNVNLTLVESLLDSVKSMTNQAPDMRLYCNHDGPTCRKTHFDGTIQHGETGSPLDP